MISKYTKITLQNGARLLLVPMDGVDSVATSVMVGVGSRHESRSISGISHFLEHMVFKGTRKYPTTDDVNIVERIGGLQNAYTDIDITCYHNKVLSGDWELALEINKELALNPLIVEKNVDRERSVILEEMKRYEDEPAAKAEETLHTMMYPGTKLGQRTIGEVDSLKSITDKDLHKYHDDWYMPNKIVVVIAGKLKTHPSTPLRTKNLKLKSASQNSKLTDQVNEWFGKLSPKKTDYAEVVAENQKIPLVAVVTKPDAQQAHFFLGLRTFSRHNPDRFAWNVFNLLMGVSFTSRLFREIREKRGLCYQIRSASDNWDDVGGWNIYAGVATDRVSEAVRAIIHELSKVRDQGVKEGEVAVAKKRLTTMLTFKSEDPEFMGEFYGRQELFGQPIITLDQYLLKINAVTKKDIDALTKEYLKTETLNLALVWNRGADEKLHPLLKI
ncbi:hypothetical protein A2154_01075 [Candidatus Gottesmanbacteria bacterium RBG_16_43_7]|uniref:Peptidase M16 n=1 Tax=Candidatus Gottesmanbacteria bacterium RBG_16_43_7 TaxID=1798373 RepID=A0A1F5Z8S5_9BACT|nr:MAG: hypothetical protein A2154_01075 [Candidatus Gottesmanbacteria bacterium RBG_16_43_7]